MKRVLVILALTSVFFTGFIFGFDESWVTANSIGNPDAEIVLSMSIGVDYTVASSYEARRAWAYEIYTNWARKHPNVRIEVELRPSGDISVYMAKLLNQAAVGRAPDICNIDSFWLSNFTKRGYVASIDEFMSDEEKNQWFDFTKAVCQIDGEQFALWGETDARYLYYRKDMFPKAPETWEELIEYASAASEEYGVHGFLTIPGHGEGAVNECTWPYFWAQGGVIFDEDGRPVFGEGKNKEILISIYQWYLDLIEAGASPQMMASFNNFDNILAEYKAGNAASFIEGSWAVSQLKELDSEQWEKIGMAPFPQKEAGQRANSNGGWTFCLFTDDPEKKAEAFNFVWECFMSEAAMAHRCMIYNYIPVRKDIFEDFAFFKEDPLQQLFGESLQYGQARPASPLYTVVSDSLATALGNILMGRQTPAEAIDQAQKTVLEAYEEQK